MDKWPTSKRPFAYRRVLPDFLHKEIHRNDSHMYKNISKKLAFYGRPINLLLEDIRSFTEDLQKVFVCWKDFRIPTRPKKFGLKKVLLLSKIFERISVHG